VRNSCGERYSEGAAAVSSLAFDADFAAVQVDEMTDNRKAESKTGVQARTAAVGLHKRFKDMRQEFRLYPDSGIAHTHTHEFAGLL
jgi:hypothetical protein